jgi:endo-1,4-beta-xylanase
MTPNPARLPSRRGASVVALSLLSLAGLPAGESGGERAPAGKFFGMIWRLDRPNQYFGSLFDQLTGENASKWVEVEPSPGVRDWSRSDALFAMAQQCSEHLPVSMRWHLLLSGDKYSPFWVPQSRDPAAATWGWIDAVGARYGDRVAIVDAVSEPLHFPPSWRKHLGGTGSTGHDWIIRAHERARAAFPGARLLIDEFDVLKDQRNRESYLGIIRLLNERKLVDVVGEEAMFLEGVSPQQLRERLDHLATCGLPIYITQYAASIADDRRHLEVVRGHMRVFYEHPAVIGVNHWGLHQGEMWEQIQHGYLIRRDGSERPALTWLRSYLGRHRPPRPTWLQADPVASDAVTLRWLGCGPLASGYRVEVQREGAWQPVATPPPTPVTASSDADAPRFSVRIEGLADGRAHVLRVVATNDHGASPGSEPITISTTGPLLHAASGMRLRFLGEPSGLALPAWGRGTVRHVWEESVEPGTWRPVAGDANGPAEPTEPMTGASSLRRLRCQVSDERGTVQAGPWHLLTCDPAHATPERDGRIELAATAAIIGPGTHAWQRRELGGVPALVAASAISGTWNEAEELVFPVRISTAGRWRLAVRLRETQLDRKRLHWGVDATRAEGQILAKGNTWSWQTSANSLPLTAGPHLLRISRRSAGLAIAELALVRAEPAGTTTR